MTSFRCADVGIDCTFEVNGASSKDEVSQIAVLHAKVAHGMTTISPELAAKVSQAIH